MISLHAISIVRQWKARKYWMDRTFLFDAFPSVGSASHQGWSHLPQSADCGPSTTATITTTSSSSSHHLVNKGQAIRHLDGQLICHPLDKCVSVRSCPRSLIQQQAVKVKRFKEHLYLPFPILHALPLPTFHSPPVFGPTSVPPGQVTEQKNPFGMRCWPTQYKASRLWTCHPYQQILMLLSTWSWCSYFVLPLFLFLVIPNYLFKLLDHFLSYS